MTYPTPGSPAEKADLEVADEILEINGASLDNSTHTDVIAHIHNVRPVQKTVLFNVPYCNRTPLVPC